MTGVIRETSSPRKPTLTHRRGEGASGWRQGAKQEALTEPSLQERMSDLTSEEALLPLLCTNTSQHSQGFWQLPAHSGGNTRFSVPRVWQGTLMLQQRDLDKISFTY